MPAEVVPGVHCAGPLSLLYQLFLDIKTGDEQESLQSARRSRRPGKPQSTDCHIGRVRAVSVMLHRVFHLASEEATTSALTKATCRDPTIEKGPKNPKMATGLDAAPETAEVFDGTADPPPWQCLQWPFANRI